MSSAKSENRALPKRFYECAGFEALDGGFVVTLDGKKVRTPAKNLLQIMLQQIAAAIVVEWDAQIDVIDTDTMPLTRLAHITLDLVPKARADLLTDINRYVETDLLCYRAPIMKEDNPFAEDNFGLRQKQDAIFDPILAWVRDEFGSVFLVTDGIVPVDQSPQARANIAAVFAAATNSELASLAMLVPMLGSALLALALWKEKISEDEALVAARLDEDAQAGRWGVDMHVTKAWAAKARDIRAGAFFLTAK